MQTGTIQSKHCLCGHLLHTQAEQAKGWCIECGMQTTLNEARVSGLITQGLRLLAHMAHKAIVAEQVAVTSSYKKPPDEELAFFSAYQQCHALDQIARASTEWAYVSARLWLLQEQEEDNREHKATLTELHRWSVRQFQRLFTIHLAMQTRLQDLCEAHHILLSFRIIDQMLDLAHHNGETLNPAKEEGQQQ